MCDILLIQFRQLQERSQEWTKCLLLLSYLQKWIKSAFFLYVTNQSRRNKPTRLLFLPAGYSARATRTADSQARRKQPICLLSFSSVSVSIFAWSSQPILAQIKFTAWIESNFVVKDDFCVNTQGRKGRTRSTVWLLLFPDWQSFSAATISFVGRIECQSSRNPDWCEANRKSPTLYPCLLSLVSHPLLLWSQAGIDSLGSHSCTLSSI